MIILLWSQNSGFDTKWKIAGLIVACNLNPKSAMGSEDFAYMLQEKPGAYIWIGNGDGEGSCMVHNPGYDFNDEILPIGATWWVKLTETSLPLIT